MQGPVQDQQLRGQAPGGQAAATAAAVAPVRGSTPSPALTQTVLHIPWTLDQFQWDPAALTATQPVVSAAGTAAAAPAPAAGEQALREALVQPGSGGRADAASMAGDGTHTGSQLLSEWSVELGAPSAAAGVGSSGDGIAGNVGRRSTLLCQVCHSNLSGLKEYYQRYKICPDHCTMPCIVRGGDHIRFCQQCGKFQPLGDFDAEKRTCRRKLERHNERRRNLTSKKKQVQGIPAAGHTNYAPATTITLPAAPVAPGRHRQQKRAASAEAEAPPTGRDQNLLPMVLPPPAAGAAFVAAVVAAGKDAGLDLEAMDLDELPVLSGPAAAAFGSPPSATQLQQLLPLSPEWESLLSPLPLLLGPSLPHHMARQQLGVPQAGAAATEGPDVGLQLRQQQCQPPPHQQQGAAPSTEVVPDFDALIQDLFGAGPGAGQGSSHAWLAELLLPATATRVPSQQQQQQGGGQICFVPGLPVQHDSLAGTPQLPRQAGPPQPLYATPSCMPSAATAPCAPLAASIQPGGAPGLTPGQLAALPELHLQQLVAPQPPPQLPPSASLQQALEMIQWQQLAAQSEHQRQEAEPQQLQEQAHSVRLSMKLFSVTPEQLPLELRRELSALLCSPNLEGYLRPGCVHLTLEALLPDPAGLAALRQCGVVGAVHRLLEGKSGLARLLQAVPALVQLADEVALVSEGRVVRMLQLASCAGILPWISNISPIALHTTQQPWSSRAGSAGGGNGAGRVNILVRGHNLVGPQQRLLVRSGGHYPLVEVPAFSGPVATCSGGAAASSAAAAGFGRQAEEWMEIRLPQVQQGLYSVEVQRGALLSSSRELLALDDAAAVAELRQLEGNLQDASGVDAFLRSIALVLEHRQLQAKALQQPCGSNGTDFAEEGNKRTVSSEDGPPVPVAVALAAAAACAARAAVVLAAGRGWPALTTLLLPSVTADGGSAEHAVRDMDARCPAGTSLLQLSTAGGSGMVLQALAAWGQQQAFAWDVRAPAGGAALTPLHLAAAARSGLLVKALFEMDPDGARQAWHTALTSDGLSPAAFAVLAGAHQQAAAPASMVAPDAVAAASCNAQSLCSGPKTCPASDSCHASSTSIPCVSESGRGSSIEPEGSSNARQAPSLEPSQLTTHKRLGSSQLPGSPIAVVGSRAASSQSLATLSRLSATSSGSLPTTPPSSPEGSNRATAAPATPPAAAGGANRLCPTSPDGLLAARLASENITANLSPAAPVARGGGSSTQVDTPAAVPPPTPAATDASSGTPTPAVPRRHGVTARLLRWAVAVVKPYTAR